MVLIKKAHSFNQILNFTSFFSGPKNILIRLIFPTIKFEKTDFH